MKKHRNLILFIVLILLIGLVFFLRNREPKEKILRVMDADSTSVYKIEVFNAADTVIVIKKEDQWFLDYPDQFKANPDVLSYFFETVLRSTYSNMPMSEKADALERYGLNKEKALNIKLYGKNGKSLASCQFGNPGSAYDYFRFENDNRIFQVKETIYSRLQPSIETWRSPSIIGFQWDQMSTIDVKHTKNSYTLTRMGMKWEYTDKREHFEIPEYNQTMSKILNSLQSLEAWVYKKPSEIDTNLLNLNADILITLNDQKTHTIKFYAYQEEYLMTVDNDTTRYYVVIFDQVQRFTRHAEVFKYKQWE